MARRVVAAVLILVSLALLTIYLREDEQGGLHGAQRLGLALLHPFEVAGERVARPFQDAYDYVSDLVTDKSDRDALEARIGELEQQAGEAQILAEENARLRQIVGLLDAPLVKDFDKIVARILVQPTNAFDQKVIVAAGSADGVALNAPVIAGDGSLVGLVTNVTDDSAQVTLLTDQSLRVSAKVVATDARGIVEAARSGSGLVLDRVEKQETVEQGQAVATAGWQSGQLSSLYPAGIPIGRVISVGQRDIDLFKQIQVQPAVDFDQLSEVVILVKR